MTEFDVLKVAGNAGRAGITTAFIMKSSDGTPGGALTLLGTAAVVPNEGAIRNLAGEFAFSVHVPHGAISAKQIVVLDNHGNQIKPRTVTIDTAANTMAVR